MQLSRKENLWDNLGHNKEKNGTFFFVKSDGPSGPCKGTKQLVLSVVLRTDETQVE